MAFTLPDLPYAYDALAPYMSAETLEFHHDKHHNAYVVKGNELAEAAGMGDLSLEEIIAQSFGKMQGSLTMPVSTTTTFISGIG